MQVAMPDSFRTIILWFDPIADLARALGLPPQNVVKMKDRNFVPPQYWRGLIRACRRSGRRISPTQLMILTEQRWLDAA